MSLYLLLVGVLVFACMAVFASKVGYQARLRGQAYQLAQQQIETLRSTSFENLSATGLTSFQIPPDVIKTMPGSNNTKYELSGQYVIEDLSTTLKQVSVQVRWRNATTHGGKAGPWSEVRLATVLSKPGSVTAGSF